MNAPIGAPVTLRARLSDLGLGFAIAAAVAAALASLGLAAWMSRGIGDAEYEALFVWTVRTDLLGLALLVVLLLVLARRLPLAGSSASPTSLTGRLVHRGAIASVGLAAVAAIVHLPELALLFLSFAALLSVGTRLMGSRERGPMVMLLTAYGVRLAVAIGFSLYGIMRNGYAYVFDDEVAYRWAAIQMADVLKGLRPTIHPEWHHLTGQYLDLLGVVFATPGLDFTAVRFMNAAFGALSVGMVYAIARSEFGPRAALVVGWLVALWPNLVLWSGSGLREGLAWMLALMVPWALSRARFRSLRALERAGLGAIALLSLYGLATARWESAIAATVALLAGGAMAVWRRRSSRRTLLLAPSIALVVLGVVGLTAAARGAGSGTVIGSFTPRALEYRAAASELTPRIEHDGTRLPPRPDPSYLALGTVVRVQVPGEPGLRTGMTASYDRSTEPPHYRLVLSGGGTIVLASDEVNVISDENVGWDVVFGRFLGGLKMLFIPSGPGGSEPMRRLATAPDTLLWDALVFAAAGSVWWMRRKLPPLMVVIVVFVVLGILGLAAVSTNLGTLVRHRGILVPWLAVLAAPALAGLAVNVAHRWRAGRHARVQQPEPRASLSAETPIR